MDKSAGKGKRLKRRIMGFTVVEVIAVATMVGGVPMGAYTRAKSKAHQAECTSNLQQIGQLLQMYVMENGEYPRAAFFPANPRTDADSIRVMLSDIPEKMWLCPGLPDALHEKGLTFVYNDSLGGQRSLDNPDKKWVLIEMTCVSKKAPFAHPTGYNVLFASGRVITTNRLPSRITETQQARLEQLQRDFMIASHSH